MRALLFFFLIIPMTCYGLMPEECQYEGEVNGKKIILTWTCDDVRVGLEGSYGLKGSPIYGFCTEGNIGGGLYDLRCSATKGGKQTVYYVTPKPLREGYLTLPLIYMCESGCKSNIVQKFINECQGD